jgi:hypothetical protein
MTFIYLKSQKIILYDNTGLIDRLWFKLRKYELNSSNIGRRFFYFILHDGNIKYIEVGNSINSILKEYNFSYDSDNYLNVIDEKVQSHIGPLSSYNKSFISNGKRLFSSEEEYNSFILNNQEFYLEDYLNKLSASNNLDKLRLEFGDIFNELLAEERDKKINLILD